MTSKVKGSEGIELPDSTVQGSAAYSKAESDGPAFAATFNGTTINPTVLTDMVASTTIFDTDAAYSTVTGRFTPQVAGYYQVNAEVGGNESVGGLEVRIVRVNTIFSQASAGIITASFQRINASTLVYMNGTTDYLRVQGYTASGALTAVGRFSAALVRKA